MLNLDTCFIIAEAGTCHADGTPKGRLSKAINYVHAAKTAGANAIKFQMFYVPTIKNMFCWINGDEERCYRWYQSRLSIDQWKQVKLECDELGIVFLASVFEYETIKYLIELQVSATKVAS
ncbi:hypothetical protein LCGC14_3092020, partial [marine sediment metagenome]